MRLTCEADYAIRIVYFLAKEQKKLEAASLSEMTGVTLRFTLKILSKLKKAEIVRSIKGISGGYVLGKDKKDISLLNVIEAIDGPIAINKCIENASPCSRPDISEPSECPFCNFLKDINNELIEKLSAKTFNDI